MTGLNMALSIHFLAAIENAGYFEADVSKNNLFRDTRVSTPMSSARTGAYDPWRSLVSASTSARNFSSSTR